MRREELEVPTPDDDAADVDRKMNSQAGRKRRRDFTADDRVAERKRLLRSKEVVRLPNDLVGRCLDHGKRGKFGLHYAAIRIYETSLLERVGAATTNYALNEKFVRSKYGFSRYGFNAGRCLLEEITYFTRHQPRPKSFAVETVEPATTPNYVSIPVTMLVGGSADLALLAAILVSKEQRSLREVCDRIGVSAPDTRTRLLERLEKTGLIAEQRLEHGEIFVARHGHVFVRARQTPKILLPKNVLPKKRGAQLNCKDSIPTEKTPSQLGVYTSSISKERQPAGVRARLREIRRRIQHIDRGKIVAPALLTDEALLQLDLMARGDEDRLSVALDHIASLNLAGEKPGKIRTWSYYADKIEEAASRWVPLVNGVPAKALARQGTYRSPGMSDVAFMDVGEGTEPPCYAEPKLPRKK